MHAIIGDDKSVRYFLAGYTDENGVAFGIIYGYVGGGEHQDWLVENNKVLHDDGEIEYDEIQRYLEGQTYPGAVDEVYAYVTSIMKDDTEGFQFYINGEPGFYDMGQKITPIPYGNTY